MSAATFFGEFFYGILQVSLLMLACVAVYGLLQVGVVVMEEITERRLRRLGLGRADGADRPSHQPPED